MRPSPTNADKPSTMWSSPVLELEIWLVSRRTASPRARLPYSSNALVHPLHRRNHRPAARAGSRAVRIQRLSGAFGQPGNLAEGTGRDRIAPLMKQECRDAEQTQFARPVTDIVDVFFKRITDKHKASTRSFLVSSITRLKTLAICSTADAPDAAHHGPIRVD